MCHGQCLRDVSSGRHGMTHLAGRTLTPVGLCVVRCHVFCLCLEFVVVMRPGRSDVVVFRLYRRTRGVAPFSWSRGIECITLPIIIYFVCIVLPVHIVEGVRFDTDAACIDFIGQIEKFETHGSGFTLKSITDVTVVILHFNPFAGSSFIKYRNM